jgi:CobQ-like glutamine amidotransferase family enzyme
MIVCEGPLLVVVAYPDLTLPQADDGNALVLAHHARARGLEVETRVVRCGETLPSADVYVIGGLEDEDMAALATWLSTGGVLSKAVGDGAAVLGVNSGYQVLGERFETPDGAAHDGLGLLSVRSRRGEAWRDSPVVTRASDALGLPALSGYESHWGVTELGRGVDCLAEVDVGYGNGGSDAPREGAVAGRVFGTYVHGPLLARNPELADYLLGLVLGRQLEPLPSSHGEASRRARIAEARAWVARGKPHVKM